MSETEPPSKKPRVEEEEEGKSAEGEEQESKEEEKPAAKDAKSAEGDDVGDEKPEASADGGGDGEEDAKPEASAKEGEDTEKEGEEAKADGTDAADQDDAAEGEAAKDSAEGDAAKEGDGAAEGDGAEGDAAEGEDDDKKERRASTPSKKSNSNEMRYGENEVVAVALDDEPLAFGLLEQDVLVGFNKEDEVTISWYEEDKKRKKRSGKIGRRTFTLSGAKDTIPVGSFICSVSGQIYESKDQSKLYLRGSTEKLVQDKYKAQCEDDYDSGADEDVGDESFRKRQARRRLMVRLPKKRGDDEFDSVASDAEPPPDDDGGDEMEWNEEDEAQSSARKRKRTPSKLGSPSPAKRKRGLLSPRPDIKVQKNPFLVKTGTIDYFDGDLERSCKEAVRIARAKDGRAAKTLFSSKCDLVSFNVPQCLELPLTALHYAILDKNKTLVTQLLDKVNVSHPGVKLQKCTVTTLTSGRHGSRFADHHHRQVQASRGGKEGNAAFTRDVDYSGAIATAPVNFDSADALLNWPFDGMDNATRELGKYISFFGMFDELDKGIFDLVCTKFTGMDQLDLLIDTLVLHGARTLAHALIEANLESFMGFNFLHAEALGNKPAFSKEFKKVSVRKMSMHRSRLTPVHCAATNPKTKLLEELLKVDPGASDVRDAANRNLLHYAAGCVSDAPLKFLFGNTPSLERNLADKTGITPLMVAAKASRPACVRTLMQIPQIKGAGGGRKVKELKERMLSTKDRSGFTPLHWAILGRRSANADTVAALIKAKADVNAPASPARNKQTPLHLAAALGDLPIAKQLVAAGASAGAVDKLGRTTAMLAAKNGHIHVLSYLLNKGVDPDAEDSSENTAIAYAAAYGWDDCVSLLLSAGADANSNNSWKTSVLQVAIEKGRNRVAQLLLNCDRIDLNYRDSAGKTMLMRLLESHVQVIHDTPVSMEETSDEDLLSDMNPALQQLIAMPELKVGIADAEGRNELHVIADSVFSSELAQRKSVALTKKLIELVEDKVAYVRATDENGLQPLLLAAKNGNSRLFRELVDAGADLGSAVDAQGRTILHHLCSGGGGSNPGEQVKLLQLLLDANEESFKSMCKTVDAGGLTPLLTAALAVAGLLQSDSAGTQSREVDDYDEDEYDEETDEEDEDIEEEEDEEDKMDEEPKEDKDDAEEDKDDAEEDKDDAKDVDAGNDTKEGGEGRLGVVLFVLKQCPEVASQPVLPKAEFRDPAKTEKLASDLDELKRQMDSPYKSKETGAATLIHILASVSDPKRSLRFLKDVLSKIPPDTLGSISGAKNDNGLTATQLVLAEVLPKTPHQSAALDVIKELISSGCADKDELTSPVCHPFKSEEAATSQPTVGEVESKLSTAVKFLTKGDEKKHKLPETILSFVSDLRCARAAKPDWAPRLIVHEIIRQLQPDTIRALKSDLGLDLGRQDSNGDTLLHLAARQGKTTAASMLHEIAPDLCTVSNKDGLLPLHLAAEQDNPDLLSTLVSKDCLDTADGKGRTALLIAVGRAVERSSNSAIVTCETILLENGANVAATDKTGRNALHHAFLGSREEPLMFNFPHGLRSSSGSPNDPIELVSTLCNVKSGSSAVTTVDNEGRTPLHYAAAVGGVVSCLLLLKRGASLSVKDSDGNTPLALAILRKHTTLAIMLIKSSGTAELGNLQSVHSITDVRRNKDHKTGEVREVSRVTHSCFWHACRDGFEGLVYVLLDDFPYDKAIADALDCGSFELVRKLLSTCPEDVIHLVDGGTGMTVSHRLASVPSGDAEWLDAILDVLIRRKADLSVKDKKGRTALHYAAANHQEALCKKLIGKGLSPKDSDTAGITPFLAVFESDKEIKMDLLAILRDSSDPPLLGATLTKTTSSPKPVTKAPFLTVTGGPNAETVESTKKPATKVDGTKSSPRQLKTTPVVEAVKRKNLQLLFMLARNGADVDTRDGDGLSPIHYAVLGGDVTFVHALARLGANLNQQTADDDAIPPLMLHSTGDGSQVQAVRGALVEYGADHAGSDANGNTALHVAVRENNKDSATNLLRAAAEAVKEGTPPELSEFKDKDVLIRFGRSPVWYRGSISSDEESVLAAVPGHKSNKNASGDKDEVDALHMVGTLMRRVPGYPALSVAKLLDQGIKTVEALSKADGGVLRRCCDGYDIPGHVRDAVNQYNEMFPPASLDRSALLRFPASAVSGIGDAGEFDREALINRRLAEKTKHLDEADRAELRLKHFGAEHLLVDDSAVAPKFRERDVVLLQDHRNWVSWHQGSVTRVNENGTYDVALVRGPIVTGALKTRLWSCPESMRVPKPDGSFSDVSAFANAKNSSGKSALDIVVKPFEFGSFENVELATVLIKNGAEVTEAQVHGCRPDSTIAGTLAAAAAGSGVSEPEAMDVDSAVDKIDTEEFEKDLVEALLAREEVLEKEHKESPPPVSEKCELDSAGLSVMAVAEDGAGTEGYFDVTLTKVDIQGWPHGTNNFYKMQIVTDPIKGVFVLINNWGRIGDYYGGKHQQTPFSSRGEAVREFEKVFRSKTGNSWAKRSTFAKVANKYGLVKVAAAGSGDQKLPRLAETETAVEHDLPEAVCGALKEFSDPARIQGVAQQIGLDLDCFPLGKLKMEMIVEAEAILRKVKEAISKQQEISQKSTADVKGLRAAMEDVANLSSQFFEIFPTKEGDTSIMPLDEDSLAEKFQLIHNLKDVTVASQVVITATSSKVTATQHPFKYCLRALGTSLEPLEIDALERRCIEQYLRNTRGDYSDIYVRNVFAVRRSVGNVATREIGNHRLLWHGTPTGNMMGILRDGLRIAPPEAPQSGLAFGRGIYCADKFYKAFGYCRRSGKDRAYLFLVEVALGRENKVSQPVYMEEAPSGFQSTMALGRKMPDPAKNVIVGKMGAATPLGELVDVKGEAQGDSWRLKGEHEPILDDESVAKVNMILADPSTRYPVDVAVVDSHGSKHSAKIEMGPVATEISVKQVKGSDGSGAKKQGVVYHRVRNDERGARFHVEDNEYIVYDVSQVAIRYIVEIDDVSSLKDEKSKSKGTSASATQRFKIDDKVKVTSGADIGVVGTVLGIDGDEAIIEDSNNTVLVALLKDLSSSEAE